MPILTIALSILVFVSCEKESKTATPTIPKVEYKTVETLKSDPQQLNRVHARLQLLRPQMHQQFKIIINNSIHDAVKFKLESELQRRNIFDGRNIKITDLKNYSKILDEVDWELNFAKDQQQVNYFNSNDFLASVSDLKTEEAQMVRSILEDEWKNLNFSTSMVRGLVERMFEYYNLENGMLVRKDPFMLPFSY